MLIPRRLPRFRAAITTRAIVVVSFAGEAASLIGVTRPPATDSKNCWAGGGLATAASG